MSFEPIFVCGCQRSGTSVVWVSLIEHPELVPSKPLSDHSFDPKEIPYFRNLFGARRLNDSPVYRTPLDDQYFRDTISATLEFCAREFGNQDGRFVNGNPADGLFVEEILRWIPGAKIIFLLRHPQEALWSALHAPWRDANAALNENEVRRLAYHWNEFGEIATRILAGDFGPAATVVRHEDILERPDSVASLVAQRVGIGNPDAIARRLRGRTFNSSFSNDSDPIRANRMTKRMIADSDSFRRLVVNHIGESMEALGYGDLGNPPLVPKSARWQPSVS